MMWRYEKDGRLDGKYFVRHTLDGREGYVSFMAAPECPTLLMDRICRALTAHDDELDRQKRAKAEGVDPNTTRRLVSAYIDAAIAHRDQPSMAASHALADANAELRAHCGGHEQAVAAIRLYEQELIDQ